MSNENDFYILLFWLLISKYFWAIRSLEIGSFYDFEYVFRIFVT